MIVDQKFTIVVQSTLFMYSWSQTISPAVLSQKSGTWRSFLEIVVCWEVAHAGRQGVEAVVEVVAPVVEEIVVEAVVEAVEEVVEEPVEDLVEDCSVKVTPVWQKVRNGSTYLHTLRKSIH